MRILVYGAGPIGSLYAARLKAAGEDVTLLARGQRLHDLHAHGVVLENAFTHDRQTVVVPLTEALKPDDIYDMVIVAMRKNNISAILPDLAKNRNVPTYLFMVNTASGPGEWISALGRERILPGFPGAGGTIQDGVLHYGITHDLLQATTVGELDGQKTPRVQAIASALRRAGFEVTVCPRMDAWLKTHVAVVGPIAWALYAAGGDTRRLARTPDALTMLIGSMREAFTVLHAMRVPITPSHLCLLEWLPEPVLRYLLRWALGSHGAEVFIGAHANAVRDELAQLAVEFGQLARSAGVRTPLIDQVTRYIDVSVSPLPSGSATLTHTPN